MLRVPLARTNKAVLDCSGLVKLSLSLPSTGLLSRMKTLLAASMPTHTLLR